MESDARRKPARHGGTGMLNRLFGAGRRRSLLMAAAGGVALVAVACGGGGDDVTDAPTAVPDTTNPPAAAAPQMFDANGNPTDELAGVSVVERSEDAVNLDLTTFQHGDFSLNDLAGQAVVVNFWFPSCPPCRAELPDIQASHVAHADDDVQFIGIQLLGLDSAEEGDEFLQDLGITYPNGADTTSSIIRQFKVTGFPTTIFLNREHEISKKWTGILNEDRLEEEIAEALIQ